MRRSYVAHMPLPSRSSRALVLGVTLALTASGAVAVAAARHEPGRAALQGSPWEVPPAPASSTAVTGRITDMVRVGDRILVRGPFDSLGAYSGSGMPVDPATGERVSAPELDGQVSVAIPDGHGGWFVGGDFDHVGDVPAGGVAHLDSAGVPDPDFAPDVDGLVSALALDGDTLWFGGIFERVDGTHRKHLASLSVSTGELTTFSAPQSRRVTELAFAPASGDRPARLYVGSDRLLAVDPTTGATDLGFAAHQGDVRALLVDGDRVYVGGPGLAALDADSGAVVDSFGVPAERFPAGADGVVHTLLLDGGRLYAGGDFGSLGGADGPLVSLDPATGAADPGFAPDIARITDSYADSGVFDLTTAGGRLWAGGAFAEVGGQPAPHLAALDPVTGARVAVDLPMVNDAVNAVDASGDGLYVGGQFLMTDAVEAPGFAAVDATTLLPIADFDAARNGRFGSMVADGDVVYVGRTNFDGYSRWAGKKRWYYPSTDRIRAVDPVTGAARSDLGLRKVKDLSGFTAFGGELYVAQRLENDRKFPRTRVSVYSSETGKLARRFRLPLRGYVSELGTLDGRLLAAGSFRRVRPNGQKAHLAAIEVSPRTGRLNSGFDPHSHGPIRDIEVHDGDLYVEGIFGKVHTGTRFVKRPGVAKYATTPSGFATMVRRFDPPASLARLGIERLVGLDDALFIQAYGRLFLDDRTGARLPDPTHGHQPTVDAVLSHDGLVYSAHTYANLAGRGYYQLGFLARAAE